MNLFAGSPTLQKSMFSTGYSISRMSVGQSCGCQVAFSLRKSQLLRLLVSSREFGKYSSPRIAKVHSSTGLSQEPGAFLAFGFDLNVTGLSLEMPCSAPIADAEQSG
jgi:hypothetical protein